MLLTSLDVTVDGVVTCRDQESGQLMGFGVDMLMEACAVANKMCAPVYVMDMAECWDSMDRRSRGKSV